MRLSELIGREVRDHDDAYVGTVADVVLRQEGAVQHGFADVLAVRGLVLVERRHVRLLGYERDMLPALLRWLLHALAGRVRYVGWDAVVDPHEQVLRLRVRGADLPEHDPSIRRRSA